MRTRTIAGLSVAAMVVVGGAAVTVGLLRNAPAPPPPAHTFSASGPPVTLPAELAQALVAVRDLPAVASVTEEHPNAYTQLSVTMTAAATPAQIGAVPVVISEKVENTRVILVLVAGGDGDRITTTTEYDGTFDQHIDPSTATAIASGMAAVASAPGVTEVTAEIPYTMTVAAGSLTVTVNPADDASLAAVRSVIDTTVFAGTTLHGSFSNGAKP